MIKNINNLCKRILDENKGIYKNEQNPFMDAFGKSIAGVAGDVVTGLTRASGIPLLAGASGFLGKQTNKALVNHFNKLFLNKKNITNNVKNNYYFYRDNYKQYQSGNYGYDLDLPKDRLSNTEIFKMKNYLLKSFKKFGYNLKVIGKRSVDGYYPAMLFKKDSRIPILDGRRNPIIYPILFDVFDDIKDDESSDIAVWDCLILFGLVDE